MEGTENTHSNFYTQKFYEVSKYLFLTDHGYLGYAVVANKRFWDRLPLAARLNLEQAMSEATAYANKIAKEENNKALARLIAERKAVIYRPSAKDLVELKNLLKNVHTKMAARIGSDLIEAIQKATALDSQGVAYERDTDGD